jgi:uncharacterized membrane protein YhaH (DUF805 family)
MNRVARIILNIVITTIVFGAIFVVFILASTLIFQGHMHPDEWTTTFYDQVIMIATPIIYIAVLFKRLSKIFNDNDLKETERP